MHKLVFILIVNTTHSRHCTNRTAGHYCYTRLLHMNLLWTMHCDIYYYKQKLTILAVTRLTNIYTGCPRRNVPNFGRVFLMLNYTDITQNTYIQS